MPYPSYSSFAGLSSLCHLRHSRRTQLLDDRSHWKDLRDGDAGTVFDEGEGGYQDDVRQLT